MSSSPTMSKSDPACSPLAQLQPVLQSTDSPLLLPPKSPPGNNSIDSSEPSTPPTAGWDDDFFSFSTPTPKPPPRLAPMASSASPTRTRLALRDPPTPLIIPGSASSTPNRVPLVLTTASHAHDPWSVQGDHSTIEPPPRLGAAVHTQRGSTSGTMGGGGLAAHLCHHRTQSFSQFHSNTLGTDIFARSPDTNDPSLTHSVSTSSQQPTSDRTWPTMPGSAAAEATTAAHYHHHHHALDPLFIGDRGHSSGARSDASPATALISSLTSSYPSASSIATGRSYCLTSSASPAPTRSVSPSLTPSSSQSNLCSNLPSPLPRANLASSLRDNSIDSKKLFSSWIASHPPIKPIHDVSLPPSPPAAGRVAQPDEQSRLDAATPSIQDATTATVADGSVSPASSSSASSPTRSTIASTHKNNVPIVAPPSSSSSSLSSGKIYPGLKNTVGPYRLIHSIGRGSFSEVKLGIDTRTGEQVAIKVMSRAVVQSSDRLGVSVRRESELLQSIHHINIIGFRGLVETSIQTCIVLDYAPGGELFEYVINHRALASELDLQCIFSQIVDAVDYLHARNVVHRDLKLENVVLVPRAATPLRPVIKLTDFGLARVIEEDSPLLTTRCGSEDYAAPEIILGQPYDGREADVWSLGVMLYALLVGFLPFNQGASMSRKTFLHMIATADFGFPGERVLQHPRKDSAHTTNAAVAGTRRVTSHSSLKNEILREAEAAFHSTLPSAATATDPSKASNGTQTDSIATKPTTTTTPTPAAPSIITATTSTTDAPKGRIVPAMKGIQPASEEAKQLVRRILCTIGSQRPLARDLRHDPWVVLGRTTMWGVE